MELTSKQKGNLTELQCLTAFIQQGCTVSIPYGDCARYDFLVDIDGIIIKVQCKTSHMSNTQDGIVFSCRSTEPASLSGTKNRRYSKEQIDYFCTYWYNQCYLIPVEECSVEKKLRFIPPKNGQKVGISFAEDYKLEIQLDKIKQG